MVDKGEDRTQIRVAIRQLCRKKSSDLDMATSISLPEKKKKIQIKYPIKVILPNLENKQFKVLLTH